MSNPFNIEISDRFRGEEVKVVAEPDRLVYRGVLKIYHYQDNELVLYDAEKKKEDGGWRSVGNVHIHGFRSVESLDSGKVEELDVGSIRLSPLDVRQYSGMDLDGFIHDVRLNGNLNKPIEVDMVGDDRYTVISGNKRLRVAREAGLETVYGRVFDLDDFQYVSRFVAHHVGVNSEDDDTGYSEELVSELESMVSSEFPGVSVSEIPGLNS